MELIQTKLARIELIARVKVRQLEELKVFDSLKLSVKVLTDVTADVAADIAAEAVAGRLRYRSGGLNTN